jgi:hypothetical protein
MMMITVYGMDFESKEAFGLWLNTAPKNEVLKVLTIARRNAFVTGDDRAYDKIHSLYGKVESESL